tara:strand:+ start:743 stop:934 length:192 start_codon:yes stop_codon:yes gene_type:complete
MSNVQVNTISHQSTDTAIVLNDVLRLNNLSSDPSTSKSVAGDTIYNTSLNKVKFYDGNGWRTI